MNTYAQPQVVGRERRMVDAVIDWHNEHHGGAFMFCREEPCRPIVQIIEPLP